MTGFVQSRFDLDLVDRSASRDQRERVRMVRALIYLYLSWIVGAAAGAALTDLSSRSTTAVDTDVVARVGGGEFAIIVGTNAEGGLQLAERLRTESPRSSPFTTRR